MEFDPLSAIRRITPTTPAGELHEQSKPLALVRPVVRGSTRRAPADAGARYNGPIGPHPASSLRDDPFSDMPLDDPFDEVEDTLGDMWMESMISESDAATKRGGVLQGEDDEEQPMYARSVKYHRDRDFLIKYGWVRIIDPKTSKVVYRHSEGTWTEQPSVKAARRAMRDFFNRRRGERRNSDPLAQKRRRDGGEKLTSSDGEDGLSERSSIAPHRALSLLPAPLPVLAIAAVKCEEGATTISPPAAVVLAPAPAQTRSLQPYATDPTASGSKRAKTTPPLSQLVASIASLPLLLQQPQLELPCTADEVDGDDLEPGDDMDKCLRRKARNRQAAAKSRQRQQDHRRALEDEYKRLQEENTLLKRLLSESRVSEALGIGAALGPIDSLLAFGLDTVGEDIA